MSAAASLLIREPAELKQANAAEHLTSHRLADFRRCPMLYPKKKLGLIQDEDRLAYLVGRALHTLAIEGREVLEPNTVSGAVKPKTAQILNSHACPAFRTGPVE